MAEATEFQDLTGGLEFSMFVVTACHGGRRAGCLVAFATQCSIEPRRFLLCISKANNTLAIAVDAEVLVVHVLGAEQFGLARHFGELTGDSVD